MTPAAEAGRDPLHWRDHRFVVLDGLRFVAAFIVVVFHCATVLELDNVPRGYLAVDFFFALSGFVVAHAYDARLRAGGGLRGFLERRFVRLYPLCVFASVLGFIVNPDGRPRIRDMVLAFGLVPQFKEWLFPVDIPLWSLFFEVVVNVLYAVLLVRLPNRALLGVVAACSAVALYFCLSTDSIDGGGHITSAWFGLFRALAPFGVGVLLHRWRGGGLGLPPVALVPLVALLFGTMWVPPVPLGNGLYDWVVVTIVFPFLLLCGAETRAAAVARPWLTLGGEVSYPLYVVHYPLLFVLNRVHDSPRWQLKLATSAGVTLAALLLSYLAYRFYDRPVRRWLTARLARRRGALAPGGVARPG